MGHARAIAGITNIVQQMDAFKKTISNQWSVRNLEKYLKQEKSTKDTVVRSISSETENIQLEKIKKEISATIGTPVLIKRTREGQGQIIIKFKNDKEFNAIYDILKDI
jgi:ParB family chromosome partitioning protein